MTRIRRVRLSVTRYASGALAAALLSLLLSSPGCVVSEPQSPEFETDVYVPWGEQTTTGLDLIRDEEYIAGDSTGAEPLAFLLEGEVPAFRVDSALDVNVPGDSFTSGLPEVTLSSPPDREISFLLSNLRNRPAGNAPEVVDPFSFQTPPVELAALETFTWARFSGGSLTLRVRNDTGISFGGPLVLTVRDQETDARLLSLSSAALAPWSTVTLPAALAGLALHARLGLTISGESPGSGGIPVAVGSDDGIHIELALTGLAADSVLARVAEQRFTVSEDVVVASDMRVSEASILSGDLTLSAINPFPVPVQATLRFPDLARGGAAYPPVVMQFPAAGGSPVTTRIPLEGATVRAPEGSTLSSFRYTMSLISGASEGPVALGTGQTLRGTFAPATVSFSSVRGALDGRTVPVPVTERSFDLPDGLEGIEFEDASLTLDLESSVGLTSRASVELAGSPREGGGAVLVPLTFAVPASSSGTKIESAFHWDGSNSRVVDLIRANPVKIRLSGTLAVGTSGEVGTVRREDEVRGHYTLLAPFRARIRSITHRADPFSLSIDEDERDRIREDVGDAVIRGEVENHLPVGLTAVAVFAEREEDLVDRPGVVLDSVQVDPAPVDAEGRVTRAVRSAFQLNVSPEQVAYFARAKVYGQVVLRIHASDPNAVVMVTARDYARVTGMMRFSLRVKP